MKIAIIGIGNVGGTLGPAWAKAGHDVIFGVRDPNSEKVKTVLENSGQQGDVGAENELLKHFLHQHSLTP